MAAADFEEFWAFMIGKTHEREEKLEELAKQTTLCYFTSFQMGKLLVMCKEEHLRMAIMIQMFNRVIDRRGFAKEMRTLPEPLITAVRKRLSQFNCFDPVDPTGLNINSWLQKSVEVTVTVFLFFEGDYNLDLACLDERRLCILLVQMSQTGGGYWQAQMRALTRTPIVV